MSSITEIDAAERSEQDTVLLAKSTLSVIMPAYNEVATVAEILRRVLLQPVVSEIVFIDDGSTDGTWEAVQRFAESLPSADRNRLVLLQHDKNRGKGRAIRTALEQVSGMHVLIQDADLEYAPADIPKLWQVMNSGAADVVYGSRYLDAPQLQEGRFVLQTGVRFLNLLTRFLYGEWLTDQATCYKMFLTRDLRRMGLECERFGFCSEVTAKAMMLGLRFRESQIEYTARTAADGKKLRLTDAIDATVSLLKAKRWKGRNCASEKRESKAASFSSNVPQKQLLRSPIWRRAGLLGVLLLAFAYWQGLFAFQGRTTKSGSRGILLDLGQVAPGNAIQQSFAILNDSLETWLVLDTKTTCGCTRLALTQSVVPPGEFLAGFVNIRPPTVAGRFHMSGTIHFTNSGATRVDVTGVVKLPFEVEQAHLELIPGEPGILKCRVANLTDPVRIAACPDWCIVEPSELDEADKSKSFRVVPSLNDREHHAGITGHIILEDSTGFRQAVRVSASAIDDLRAHPSTLHFGHVIEGEQQKKRFVLTSHSGKKEILSELQLKSVDDQVSIRTVAKTASAIVVEATLLAKNAGYVSSEIELLVGEAKIRIPVSARIAQRKL